jgi:predicted metalloprotease
MIRRLATSAAAAAVVLMLTACSGVLGGLHQGASTDTVADNTDTATDADVTAEEIDQEIADAIDVVDQFWSAHFSEFYTGGDGYTPPSDFIPYVASDLPSCSGEKVVPDNAFYCSPDNTMLWDQALTDYLYVNGGDAVIYLVIAHEWGHAIQSQISDDSLWNAQELQADCFAAAALYGAAADGTFTWEEGDTAEITNALTFLADQTAWTNTDDHGDPLDRIDAFNDGRIGGVEGCYPVAE